MTKYSAKQCMNWIQSYLGIDASELRGRCIFIFNDNDTVPAEYIARRLEGAMNLCLCYTSGKSILLFTIFRNSEDPKYRDIVSDFCERFNLYAGVSRPFTRLDHLDQYASQAQAFLEHGYNHDDSCRLYVFEDEIMNFLTGTLLSRFDRNTLLTDGFEEIASNPILYETLRKYLDCECNASRAASELYIHRSTMAHRLRNIEKHVSLDTPKERLYLRMCIMIAEAESQLHR